MRFLAKSLLLMVSLFWFLQGNVCAQEEKFTFTWLDRSENKLAGSLIATLVPQPGTTSYQLVLSVSWFDENGKALLDVNRMPFLYLSEYYLQVSPAQSVRVSASNRKKPFSLLFQTTEKLNLDILNGFSGPVKLIAGFQYALTKSLFDSGNLEPIDVKGSSQVRMEFRAITGNSSANQNISGEAGLKPVDAALRLATTQKATADYQKLKTRFLEIEGKKSVNESGRQEILHELEILTNLIEKERSALNPDSLLTDSLQLLRERYNLLSYQVVDLRSTLLRLRFEETESGVMARNPSATESGDTIRKQILTRFQPVFIQVADSLLKLSVAQKVLATGVLQLMNDSAGVADATSRMDSLLNHHDQLNLNLQSLAQSEQSAWNAYQQAILGHQPVSELESMHLSFVQKLNELQTSVNQLVNSVANRKSSSDATPWYLSSRVLFPGLISLLIVVMVIVILNSARNRKIVQARLDTLELPGPVIQPTVNQLSGNFSKDLTEEYFTFDYQESIPESVLGVMHLHASAIKTVYHQIQGALLEKRGNDFGGYLFGSQYKLPVKSGGKTELFIEKACESRYLRSGIANDMDARTVLVDEMNELVSQNKKYRLIGWYTASSDGTLEIPEGLMKVHRSFFKEKWQTGILINPASELLQGAAFLRRKTGYLDPLPDPAAFLKWDDMFRFAMNPVPTRTESAGMQDESGDFVKVEVDSSWCDSIVKNVLFDRQAIADLFSFASNQAIPKDTYQVVGYLYGKVKVNPEGAGSDGGFDLLVSRFLEVNNESAPRELPGSQLLGWWGQSNVDLIAYLPQAIIYHENTFREAWQIACLANPQSGDFRIFSRKESMQMNNSTIETEEYQLKVLLSR